METRFRSLRIIASILKILAWIALVGGILAGIGTLIAGIAGGRAILPSGAGSDMATLGLLGGTIGGLVAGLGILLVSFLNFLFLYATGDAIDLALAIEQNTRETAWYLKGGDALRQ